MCDNTKHSKFIFVGIFVGIFLLPIGLLWTSGNIENVDYLDVIGTIITQLFSFDTAKNFPIYAFLLVLTISLLFFALALLFEIPTDPMNPTNNKILKFLQRFTPKKSWHILLGYFLTILLIHPVVANTFFTEQMRVHEIDSYQARMLTAPLVGIGLLVARLISKYDFGVLDTKVSVFMVMVWISEVVFIAMSATFIPFSQFKLFFDPHSNISDELAIYGSVIIGTGLATFLDWFIVVNRFKKTL